MNERNKQMTSRGLEARPVGLSLGAFRDLFPPMSEPSLAHLLPGPTAPVWGRPVQPQAFAWAVPPAWCPFFSALPMELLLSRPHPASSSSVEPSRALPRVHTHLSVL